MIVIIPRVHSCSQCLVLAENRINSFETTAACEVNHFGSTVQSNGEGG